MAGEERISVSREALRAELAELELRLRGALQEKADASLVLGLQSQVSAQNATLVEMRGKLAEIDHYGSQGMRELRERVSKVETSQVTEAEVRRAVGEAVREGRSRGGHRATIVAVSLSLLSFVVYVAVTVVQAIGGH